MTKSIWLAFAAMSFSLISACEGMRLPPPSPQEIAKQRAEIIERLVPEEGITRGKLSVVRDAILTVRKDIGQRDLSLNINGIRKVLNEMSLQDLRKIESILPEVERKRQLEGAD